jgi:hypothetical protein
MAGYRRSLQPPPPSPSSKMSQDDMSAYLQTFRQFSRERREQRRAEAGSRARPLQRSTSLRSSDSATASGGLACDSAHTGSHGTAQAGSVMIAGFPDPAASAAHDEDIRSDSLGDGGEEKENPPGYSQSANPAYAVTAKDAMPKADCRLRHCLPCTT